MSSKKIVFVGIDVDETAFHGAGIVRETGELFEFKCKADFGALRKKLSDVFQGRYEIRLCYEASHFGYWLCRRLRKAGIHCDIVAPSLIPMKSGVRVKTDRLDAAKLAEYYAKDMLTAIYIPDETYEPCVMMSEAHVGRAESGQNICPHRKLHLPGGRHCDDGHTGVE